MKHFKFVIIALAITAAFLYFTDQKMFFSQLKRDHIYDEKTKSITISEYSIATKDYPLLESLEIKGALVYGKGVNLEILNHLPSDLNFLSLIDSSIDGEALSYLSRFDNLSYLRLNSQTLTAEELKSLPKLSKLEFLRIEYPGVNLDTLDLSDKIPASCEVSSN